MYLEIAPLGLARGLDTRAEGKRGVKDGFLVVSGAPGKIVAICPGGEPRGEGLVEWGHVGMPVRYPSHDAKEAGGLRFWNQG